MEGVVVAIPVVDVGVVGEVVAERLPVDVGLTDRLASRANAGLDQDGEPSRQPLVLWVSFVECGPGLVQPEPLPPPIPGLLEILLGDLVQIEAELGRQVGDVPEHVAQLLGEPVAVEVHGVAVSDRLLVFAVELPDLAGQAEERDHKALRPLLAEAIGLPDGVLICTQVHLEPQAAIGPRCQRLVIVSLIPHLGGYQ